MTFTFMLLNEESYPAVLKMAQQEQFAMVILDAKAQITRANNKVYKLFDYTSKNALIGRHVLTLFSERFQTLTYHRALDNYLTDDTISVMNQDDVLMGIRYNNTAFPLEMTLAPFQAGDQKLCLAIIKPLTASYRGMSAAPEQLKQLTQLKNAIRQISAQLDQPLESVSDILDKVEDRIPADKLALLKEQIHKLQVVAGELLPQNGKMAKTVSLNKQLMVWVTQFLGGQFSVSWKLCSAPLEVVQNNSLTEMFQNLLIYVAGSYEELFVPKKLRVLTRKNGNLAEIALTHNGKSLSLEIQQAVFDPNITFTYQNNEALEALRKATRQLYLLNGSIEVSEQTEDSETLTLTLPITS